MSEAGNNVCHATCRDDNSIRLFFSKKKQVKV